MLQSRNYPPSEPLSPFISRHYVFSAELPADFTLIDRLLAETAFIRILLRGDWAAEIDDVWRESGPVPFFGANIKPLRVRVTGPFRVVGIALRPSGWRALFDQPARDCADRMLPLADLWGDAADQLLAAAQQPDDASVVAAVETVIRARLDACGSWQVDQPARAFEEVALRDCAIKVRDIAAQLGISERQLERHCIACFGHTPKMLLRRSRFLDMATVMRGLGDASERELADLRYFDQSHRAHEFRRFIGMSPTVFARTPTPLLTAGLVLRQERKAEQRAHDCAAEAAR